MGTRLRLGSIAVLAALAWLLGQPGNAQAHPQLVGRWTAVDPKGVVMTYEFGPGEYITWGIWRGPMTLTVAGCPTSAGMYELRMFSGTQGSLGIRDGVGIGMYVGLVDLVAREMTIMNVLFKP